MKTIEIIIDRISNRGGTERVASELSSLLSNHFEVIIHTIKPGVPTYNISESVEIKNYLDTSRNIKIKKIVNDIKGRPNSIILVISMGRLSLEFMFYALRYRLRNKMICSDHVSLESFNFFIRTAKKIAYIFYNRVVTLTENDRNILSKFFKKNKVVDIPNSSAYDGVKFDFHDINNKEKIVLAVGRLTKQKNFSQLLDIWKNTETQDWSLLIIGEGEDYDELSNKIKKLNLDRVKILPIQNNIQDFYRKSSLIVMTSIYEGFPLVLLEAKNFGVPTIAFDCKTGPNEIIKNDGYLINPNDEKNFSKYLEEIIGDDNLRFDLSKKSLLNSRLYSKSSVLKKWVMLINEL